MSLPPAVSTADQWVVTKTGDELARPPVVIASSQCLCVDVLKRRDYSDLLEQGKIIHKRTTAGWKACGTANKNVCATKRVAIDYVATLPYLFSGYLGGWVNNSWQPQRNSQSQIADSQERRRLFRKFLLRITLIKVQHSMTLIYCFAPVEFEGIPPYATHG